MGKLIDKQFFLIINGPSCGGKSTVSDCLVKRYEGIFNAKSDRIKWLISHYNSLEHQGVVLKLTEALMQAALSNGLSILKEGALFESEISFAKSMSKRFGTPLFIANVSAPWEILLERFEERIEAKKKGARISNIDPERFKEIYEMYLKTKIKTRLEFDSSEKSPEKIVREIVLHIQENI